MFPIYTASQLSDENLRELCIRKSMQDYAAVERVEHIVDAVRDEGLEAVRRFTREFDGPDHLPEDFFASPAEFDEAEASLSDELKDAFRRAADNIRAFHQRQRDDLADQSLRVDGARLGYRYVPVPAAALYVPGGKASYPSSVLMGSIPAKIAGVPHILIVTPPGPGGKADAAGLYCARLAGVDQVLKAGGAQGVAAAAYGVAGPPVQVIAGPGNRYVMAAKSLLMQRGLIRMDMPAGPSEVIVIADETANAEFAAADMLSQAEHGDDSPAILLTNSQSFAEAVRAAVERGIEERPARREMKSTSMREHSFALVFEDLEDAFRFSNDYGPEHLEICTTNPERDLLKIHSAGSVFLGNYAPVALGDYYSGTNHVLPTGGAARAYSGLGVDTYMKRITWQYPDEASLRNALGPIQLMSKHEGLDQEHGHSVEIRFRETN